MNSINLLPTELKEQYESSKQNRVLLGYLINISFLVLVFLGILVGSRYYLNTKLASVVKEVQGKEQSISKYGTLENDAQRLESRIKSAKKVLDNKIYFSKALNEVWKATPPKLYILTIDLDKDSTSRGKITGAAENKAEIALFIDALNKSSIFQYVDLESSTITIDSVSKQPKENFTVSYSLNQGELK